MHSAHLVTAIMALLLVAAPAALTTPDVSPLVDRFLARTDAPLDAYSGRRIMRASNRRFKKEGWLEASVRFEHSAGLEYAIVASGGSPYIIRNVLEPALAGEADLWRNGEAARHQITLDNYTFTEPAATTEGDHRLTIAPLRRHPLLLSGDLYLSADGDLQRVEGRLSKSPSFWISRVDVVRHYGRLNGIRVPVELWTAAHVRLAGPSLMQVQYLYESINGTAVDPFENARYRNIAAR